MNIMTVLTCEPQSLERNDTTRSSAAMQHYEASGGPFGGAFKDDDVSLNTTNNEIVLLDHVPFRFTRRRDRFYGFVVCLVTFVVVLGISLPLTRDRRKGGSKLVRGEEKDWTMIGEEIENSYIPDDDVLAISLALSANGQTVAIGNRHTSYVRCYHFQDQGWVHMGADLVGYDDSFGFDVALSGDGRTVAIGGPQQSAVQVFQFNTTGQWNMADGSIRGDMLRGELAGSAISLSLDGRIVAVGAHLNSDQYQRSGQVRVFQLSESSAEWEAMGSDINGDAFGDQFGGALSLSDDGMTLAIGARFHDDLDTNKTDVGYVRVYRFLEGIWVVSGSVIEGDEVKEGFGYSVSLSGDGSTCAIGNTKGELAIYRQSDAETYMPVGGNIPLTLIGDDVFAYVSLSRDGNVLAVLENQKSLQENQHSVTVFRYDQERSVWRQIGSELKGAGFALSADGSIVAVGGANIEGLEYVRVLTSS
jgi:hypothetical protein